MTVAITSLVAVLLVVIDQLTKYLVVTGLKPISKTTIIDGFLQFRYVENTGAAFGIFSNNTIGLSIFTGVMMLAVVAYIVFGKKQGKLQMAAWAFVLAGGVGNLIDRVVRHFVVDFIEFTFVNYAVFNFADCCVTIGAVLLVVSVLFDMKHEKDKKPIKVENADE